MFDLRKIPMLRVLVPFFCGILAALHLSPGFQAGEIILFSCLLWVVLFVIFLRQRGKQGKCSWLVSAFFFLLYVILGLATGLCTGPRDPRFTVDQWTLVRGVVLGPPRITDYSCTFDLELGFVFSGESTCSTQTVLKCYLPVPPDSILPAPGEQWQFSGILKKIPESRNPGMPDYRSIMGRKNTWYRFYISQDTSVYPCNRKVRSREQRFAPGQIRKKVSGHWYGDREALSLLNAVCLGDRSALSEDMRQAYTEAGGMHLLAVSGLHVGLIWWVLQYMTAWMQWINKNDRLRMVVVVGFLWLYAYITGFSSSVCRSVTMFSFFSLGRMLGNRGHPLNILLVSAFLLVLLKPVRLMDVGFQLSYAAITGIIILHSPASRLIRVKHHLLRRIWEAALVSLTAQLSTAPLVIYYFHQLPLYAILTSLIAVPLLSMLIAIFVLSLPFIAAGILEKWFSFALVGLARLMNRCMEFLSSLPGAVKSGLHLDGLSLLFWILVLLTLMIAVSNGRRLYRYLLMFLVSAWLLWSAYSCLNRHSSSELLIAHFQGASMLTFREGLRVDHYCWYRDSSAREYMKAYRNTTWSDRKFRTSVHEVEQETLIAGVASSCIKLRAGAWLVGGKPCRGLVLTASLTDSAWTYLYSDTIPDLKLLPDFILLSGEPVVECLPGNEKSHLTTLVIDGSNRSWYERRIVCGWDRIYLTDRSGAYMKRW